MPFRDPQPHLCDILTAIDRIELFLVGSDLHSYRADIKTRSAVERQLQILTEAAFRLRDDATRLCPTVDWRGVRGLGNALRHEYDEIDDEVIWEALNSRLPPLKTAVQVALAEIQGGEEQR